MFRTGRTRLVAIRRSTDAAAPPSPIARALAAAAAIALPILVLLAEYKYSVADAAVSQVARALFLALASIIDLTKAPSAPPGSLVFVASDNVKPSLITDPAFSLRFPGGVRVKRVVEYCQAGSSKSWREFYTDETATRRDSDGEEYTETIRTYYYTKGWEPMPIMSAFFDQPAAHHNPLHDPFPPTTMTAESAVLGKYTVSRPVLESANSGWSKRKSFPSEDLTDMMEISPASREGFRYIGDGFFYSTYSPTPTAQFIRAAGMALEGSLFDYQIADAVNALFGSCTPGDIRVSYDAIVASESRGGAAVGKLESDLSIGVFTSKGNYQLGLYENDMSTTPHRMLGNVLWAAWYWNLGAYALLCVWAAVLTYYIPLASLAASPIPENQRLGDTYAWCAETIGLSFATVGLARIIVSLCGGYTHFATALAISFIGVAIIGLSRNSIARAYFARSAEPHKKSS